VSLIGDALRKSRREAAERDSDRRGILYSAKIADSPTRSNLGLGIALGAVIAIVATVAGGLTVWWLFVAGESPPSTTAEARQEIPAAAGEAPLAPASSTRTGSNTEGSGDGAATPRAAEDADPTAAELLPVDPVPAPRETSPSTTRPAADPQPTAAADAEDEEERPATGFAGIENGEEIYLLEADLGGVVLSLDYIVLRAEDPFAEINGVEVHLGGTIEGFRVKAIEHDLVRLSDGRRTVVLRTP
jgi:hypothetical protein